MSARIKIKARHKPGVMNKTEAAYAEVLEARKLAGEIVEYRFEPLKLRLADLTTYSPDFLVVTKDGFAELHECKGSWKAPHQDDSRVKIKVAAELFWMFIFRSAEVIPKKHGGGWKMTEF